MTAPLVDIKGLSFAWTKADPLLSIDQFTLAPGERLFLRGPSGSGKSTFLGLVCGVLDPQSGALNVVGQDLTRLARHKRDQLRADKMGVIFQMLNLVPYLTVLQNVTLACRFSRPRRARVEAAGGAAQEATRLLAHLGLDDKNLLARKATDLSVGQQQRVAAARALIGAPDLIIADEPTSAVDADNRDRFIDLLLAEATASGAGLIFVSHDGDLAHHFDRAVDLAAINAARQEHLA
ncbi:MAG: ATP-binding cassette domain-containing protein [Pseudomonadota bacterium]